MDANGPRRSSYLQDSNGNTALHIAVQNSTIHIIKKLLEAGADPNVKNNSQETIFNILRNKDIKLYSNRNALLNLFRNWKRTIKRNDITKFTS